MNVYSDKKNIINMSQLYKRIKIEDVSLRQNEFFFAISYSLSVIRVEWILVYCSLLTTITVINNKYLLMYFNNISEKEYTKANIIKMSFWVWMQKTTDTFQGIKYKLYI